MPEELTHQLEEYGQAHAHHLELINRQQSIISLNAMMKMLLEKIDKKKKKKSPRGKKKWTLTLSEISKGEEDIEYVEEASKHSEQLDSSDSNSQCMNKIEKHHEVIANWGKLQEAWIDLPYSFEWDLVKYPYKFKALLLLGFNG